MSAPTRRVVIVRNGPLFALRCEKPCEGRGDWCMDMGLTVRGCYLGGYLTEISAATAARSCGYTLADAPA
jgi:hypothetical protein